MSSWSVLLVVAQALAVCMEVAKAVQSGHPETFLSGLAVHQDGSCNGLQHYAALGRDVDGAMQVRPHITTTPQPSSTPHRAVVRRKGCWCLCM